MTGMAGMDKKDNEKNNMQNTKQDVKTDHAVNQSNKNATPSGTTDKTKSTDIMAMVRKLLKLDNKNNTASAKPSTTKPHNGFVAKLMSFVMKTDSNVVAVASKAQEATQATDKQALADPHTKTNAQTGTHSSEAKSKQNLGSNADVVLVQKPSEPQEQKSPQVKK